MLLKCTDFNGAEQLIAGQYSSQWAEVEQVLEGMPLHVYGSDEAGKQGDLSFNVKGTNAYLEDELPERDWGKKLRIPDGYRALGQDVDFGRGGVLLEVQFANYPFLSNNVVRSDLFFNERVTIGGSPVGLLLMLTKAWMFPASQSTLYYEQAVNQLNLLLRNDAFGMPVRVVGLFEERDSVVDGVWSGYKEARHSRTEVSRESRRLRIAPGKVKRSRNRLIFAEEYDPPPDLGPSLPFE